MYLKRISEQVKRRLLGGNPSSDVKIDDREIQLHIVQAINRLLKAETFSMHESYGMSSIPHTLLATYTVDVDDYTSDEVVTSQVTNFSATGYSNTWVDANGNAWVDQSGNEWLFGGSDITIEWSLVSGSNYLITVSNIEYNTGESYVDLINFYGNVPVSGTFGIASEANNIPKNFYKGAITNFTALPTSFSFNYNLSLVSNAIAEVQADVAPTGAILTNQPSNTESEFFTNFTSTTYTITNASLGCLTLPAQPVSLPDNMGIWSVYSDPLDPFIPLPVHGVGLMNRITHTNLANAFDNVNTYRIENNKKLVFNQLSSALPDQLTVQLAIVDVEVLGELDLLPVPADMEEQVIVSTLQLLGANISTDNVNNENPVT